MPAINKVQVVTLPQGYWDKRKQQIRPYYGLRSERNDDYFYDEDDEIRKFKTPGRAVGWLRRVSKDWDVCWEIAMPDGKIERIGLFGEYGPHSWSKQNLVTLAGGYDLLRCELCGEEYRRYGFNNPGGRCPKNPRPTADED